MSVKFIKQQYKTIYIQYPQGIVYVSKFIKMNLLLPFNDNEINCLHGFAVMNVML